MKDFHFQTADSSIRPFYGVVEEIIDDVYVRVRAYEYHPLDKSLVSTKQLPPALVLLPTTSGQVSNGSHHNLEVDSWVRGEFLDYPFCNEPVITHVVPGSTYSLSTYKTNGGNFVGGGSNGSGGGDQSNPNVNTGATTNIPGDSQNQKVYNYIYDKLRREGSSKDPHTHTSAAVGVLMVESGPKINSAIEGGFKGRAWGLCQWLGRRRDQLFAHYGRTKDLSQQLDFMWWELNNTESGAKRAWLSGTTLPDATAGFATFERADDCDRNTGRLKRDHPIFRRRLQYAYQVYNSGKYTGDSTPTT